MSQGQRLLAIDPGELVGWAVGSTAQSGELALLRHGITPLKEFAVKLESAFSTYDVVIYEKYGLVKSRNREGSEMPTIQLIGMIRLLSWINPDVTLVKQSPSLKRTADKAIAAGDSDDFKNLIARESGVHDDAHDIDAIRHLYYWWWKQRVKEATHGK